jgi:phosphopantetheine adenylyltransferase
LKDKYGPAIDDPDIDSIVATEETFSTAEEINRLRDERNLGPLKIIKSPNIYNIANELITSTMIRSKLYHQNKS